VILIGKIKGCWTFCFFIKIINYFLQKYMSKKNATIKQPPGRTKRRKVLGSKKVALVKPTGYHYPSWTKLELITEAKRLQREIVRLKTLLKKVNISSQKK